MTCRTESNQTWVHEYNAENRISIVEKVTGDCTSHGTITDTWTFTYDGDGVRVKEKPSPPIYCCCPPEKHEIISLIYL